MRRLSSKGGESGISKLENASSVVCLPCLVCSVKYILTKAESTQEQDKIVSLGKKVVVEDRHSKERTSNGMDKGENITLYIEGKEYILTRTLDNQWTVWGDHQREPYRCVVSPSGMRSCDCPDFTFHRRKRRQLCKHLRAIVGLIS